MKTSKILMRTLKVLGAFFVLISLIIFLFLLLEPVLREFGEYGYYEISYPTFDDAAANALSSHRFMPPSANDIRYVGLYQDPEMWLFFNFNPAEISAIRKSCDRVNEGEVELAPLWGPPRGSIVIDWPDEITGTIRAEDIVGYEIYKCKVRKIAFYKRFREGILAVYTGKGKAYYWGP